MKFFLVNKSKGFTLLEMLLVLVIASSIIILAINYTTQRTDQLRRERTAIQMQQLLNASMAYYVANSAWPSTTNTISALATAGFLPASTSTNSHYNTAYSFSLPGSTNSLFQISTTTTSAANSQIIAGMVPLGSYTDTTVNAAVTIPGQNLNNARSVNFGGVYASGACVPAPTCPTNMKPSIMVFPTSVAGVTSVYCDTATPPNCSPVTASISSFTAFARGTSLTTGAPGAGTGAGAPYNCSASSPATEACNLGNNTYDPAGTLYWRVCLAVATNYGLIVPSAPSSTPALDQGMLIGNVVAITRCVPVAGSNNPYGDKPSGSPISVWSQ